jgi:OTU-like cysteine protease
MPAPSSREDHDNCGCSDGSVKMADHYVRRKLPIMVRQGKKSQKLSWPFMELWGLYRREIAADGMFSLHLISCRADTDMHARTGNCLFRALSDQLYNTTKRHDEIRSSVVEYVRTNRSHFEPFVLANVEDDLIRSQPTTRSSRSRKSSVDHDPFDIYLENMAKPNTWGGDIEITAFCAVYDRDVLIHRPTDAENPFTQVVNSRRAAGQTKEYVHISFGVSTPFTGISEAVLIASRTNRHSHIMSRFGRSNIPLLLHQQPQIPPPQPRAHYVGQQTSSSLWMTIALIH